MSSFTAFGGAFARREEYMMIYSVYSHQNNKITTLMWKANSLQVQVLRALPAELNKATKIIFNPRELVVNLNGASSEQLDTIMKALSWNRVATTGDDIRYEPLVNAGFWVGAGIKGPYDKVIIQDAIFGSNTMVALSQL